MGIMPCNLTCVWALNLNYVVIFNDNSLEKIPCKVSVSLFSFRANAVINEKGQRETLDNKTKVERTAIANLLLASESNIQGRPKRVGTGLLFNSITYVLLV